MGKGAKVATGIAKTIAPKMGRKIANEIGTGAVKGGISGAVEGLGRGIREDENPRGSTVKGAVMGTLGGAALGSLGGFAERGIKGQKLKNAKVDNLTKEEIKALRKQGREYYNDYLHGTTVAHPDLGEIKFTNAGIDEQVSKGLYNANLIPDLKRQIKTGQKQTVSRKDYPRNDINHFHIIDN